MTDIDTDARAADVRADASLIIAAYDWGALGDVVDVGGGNGTLLIALLNEYPALRGTVFDRSEVAETARKLIDAAGLGDRAGAVAGDFFVRVPPGAEGYLLNSVIRRWDDEDARRILRRCAEAAGADGAVFVIESVREPAARDVSALTALAESAGLTVANGHSADGVAVLELSSG